MDLYSFKRILVRRINKRLPDGVRAKSRAFKLNNGITAEGIILVSAAAMPAVPVLYAEDYYDAFLQGRDMDMLADNAAKKLLYPVPEALSDTRCFERDYVESHVILRLVNTAFNEELIAQCPHREFLDLSVVYGILLKGKEPQENLGTVMIRSDTLEKTGITEEMLYEWALRNSRELLGERIARMDEILKEMTDEEAGPQDALPLYVATNRLSHCGASVLLYAEGIARLADALGSDLLILPSSIHELILLPKQDQSYDFLKVLVKSVNETEVSRGEVLSDSVYCYVRARKRVEIFL